MEKIKSPYVLEMVKSISLRLYDELLSAAEGSHEEARQLLLEIKTIYKQNESESNKISEKAKSFYSMFLKSLLPTITELTIDYLLEEWDNMRDFFERQYRSAEGVIEECKQFSERVLEICEKTQPESVIVEE